MRLFYAVELPATPMLRELLAELGRLGGLFRPVDPEQLHLTLCFVGQTDPQQLDELGAALERVTVGRAWFNLHLHGIGTFPPGRTDGRRMPRVIYGDVVDPGPLVQMAQELRDAADRPFAAHVTLARHRARRRPSRTQRDRLAKLLTEHAERDLGIVPVRRVCLIESILTDAGPRYTVRRHAALRP